jgi:hypothetical protein
MVVSGVTGGLPGYMRTAGKPVDFALVRRLLRVRGVTRAILVSSCGVTLPVAKAFLAGRAVHDAAWFRIRQVLMAEELFYLGDLSDDEYDAAVLLEFCSVTRGMDEGVAAELEGVVLAGAERSRVWSPGTLVARCVASRAGLFYSPDSSESSESDSPGTGEQ